MHMRVGRSAARSEQLTELIMDETNECRVVELRKRGTSCSSHEAGEPNESFGRTAGKQRAGKERSQEISPFHGWSEETESVQRMRNLIAAITHED